MKKQTAITKAMMMEMCMWLCNMRMAWRAHFSAALKSTHLYRLIQTGSQSFTAGRLERSLPVFLLFMFANAHHDKNCHFN